MIAAIGVISCGLLIGVQLMLINEHLKGIHKALVDAVDKLAPPVCSGETLNEKIGRGIEALVNLQR